MIAALLLTLLAAGNTYQAILIRVVDGDTILARVVVWPDMETTASIRLRGLDTPELKGKCDSERALAQKAKAALAEMVPVGAIITLTNVRPDKYGGRYDADVQTSDGVALAERMIRAGLARPYEGKKRVAWCGVEAGTKIVD